MMRFRILNISLIILCFLSIQSLFSQNPTLEWVKQTGNEFYNTPSDLRVDPMGNVYTVGSFSGTLDLDPGTDTFNITSNGGQDTYIQKLDSNGNFLWGKHIGGNGDDLIDKLVIDELENIYMLGEFYDTVDFNPGLDTTNLVSLGMSDVFVLKLDAEGNFIWVKQIGGSNELASLDIALDNEGDIYTMGVFIGTIDIDPGIDTTYLTSVGGWSATFIQKLDESGNLVWGKCFTGLGTCFGRSMEIDDSGHIFIIGQFGLTIDFDPGVGVENITSTGSGNYIQKLDTNGDFVWVKEIEAANGFMLRDLALDDLSNMYLTGVFTDTADLDPGVGTEFLIAAGPRDSFVQKLNSNGELIWVRQIGGLSGTYAVHIAVDNLKNVYTVGTFYDTVDFDPGIDVYALNAGGVSDIFMQKLDSAGNFSWAESFGGGLTDKPKSITTDHTGHVYMSGTFSFTVDFAPGDESFQLTSEGYTDVFIQKLGQCYPTPPVPNVDILQNMSGECMVTPTPPMANTGCGDSIIGTSSISFPITTQGTTIITWTYIDDYGNTITQNQNILIEDITNPVPHVLTLPDLTANCELLESNTSAPTSTDNCSGLITATANVNFPITDQSITEIVWTHDDGNGNTVIQNQAIHWQVMNVETSFNGSLISVDEINANRDYHWLDCNNDYASLMHYDPTFEVTSNGSYAVQITENGCIDTSDCVTITTLDINALDNPLEVMVYPNPFTESFQIQFQEKVENGHLVLTDVYGKILYTEPLKNTSQANIKLKAASGIYVLTIITKDGQNTIELIKK